MDMVEYLFKEHTRNNKESYKEIELVQVVASGKEGRIATTEDTLLAWHVKYGQKLLEEARGNKVKIVFVSDNSALAIKYQDITTKVALSSYGYEIVTVGERAKQFSLSMVLDNLAKIIYSFLSWIRRGVARHSPSN